MTKPPVAIFATDAAFYPPYQGDGAHMCHLIQFLKRRGWVVHVVHFHDRVQRDVDYDAMSRLCDGLIVYYPSAADLRARASHRIDAWCPERFAALVGATCRDVDATAVLVQYVFLSKCFLTVPPATVKVLDADNIFAGRRELFEQAGIPYDWFSTTEEEEIEGWRRADVLLAVQESELEIMARAVPGADVVLAPQVRDNQIDDSAGSKDLLFVGANNEPNRQGLRAFIDEGLDAVLRDHPDAVLRVVGRVGETIEPRPGVEIAGVVADLAAEYRRAAIVLNLAAAGTGLKTKTMEAFCYGRCLVSTAAGLQGFERYPEISHAAETPLEIAHAVNRLLADDVLRQRTATAAATFARAYFSPDVVLPRIEAALERARARKSEPA